jgi:hypothetical protein
MWDRTGFGYVGFDKPSPDDFKTCFRGDGMAEVYEKYRF